MNEMIVHKISEGDRWDLIAYKYYGDISEMGRLVEVNFHLPFCEVLPMGESMLIPIIEKKTSSQDDLPPWMQDE